MLQTTATGLAAAIPVHSTTVATEPDKPLKTSIRTRVCLPKPCIKSAIRRDETILRHGGFGDGLTMTWAKNDRQYVALEDGFGFGCRWVDLRPREGMWNSRLLAISGSPHDATFDDVAGYPELLNLDDVAQQQRYYGFGTLALDSNIYQFLSTLNYPAVPGRSGAHWVGAKLIHSPDNGRTWHNQDGSTPVIWEPWEERSLENMAFFKESQDAFSLLTFLQMGRNYEHNRDGYVYVYAPNGATDGQMNELVMFRVQKRNVLNRKAYEYFSGINAAGNARWSKDIHARSPVHVFPRGWVNSALPGQIVVESWLPTVTYNAALGVYLMGNYGIGVASDLGWFGKPSYLGFWIAPQPWGPWTQIHEETAWMPAGEKKALCFDLQIAPKWISADGKSFWIVWADYQSKECDPSDRQPARLSDPTISEEERMIRWRKRSQCIPYYSFNCQRVDLVLT